MAKKTNYYNSRRISFCPRPSYFSLFVAFAHENLTSKPKTAELMVKKFIDNLSDSEKNRLNKKFESMTPEQKRRTETIRLD